MGKYIYYNLKLVKYRKHYDMKLVNINIAIKNDQQLFFGLKFCLKFFFFF